VICHDPMHKAFPGRGDNVCLFGSGHYADAEPSGARPLFIGPPPIGHSHAREMEPTAVDSLSRRCQRPFMLEADSAGPATVMKR
jgi:hypothetical protein